MSKQRLEKNYLLSYKLRCYTRISSPQKNHNNLCEKKTKLFYVFDNANHLLTHHLLFVPFAQVDKLMAKPSPFPIKGHLLEFSRIMAVKTLKNLYCLQEVTFNHFIEGMENQNTKRKTKTCIFSGFGNGISCH